MQVYLVIYVDEMPYEGYETVVSVCRTFDDACLEVEREGEQRRFQIDHDKAEESDEYGRLRWIYRHQSAQYETLVIEEWDVV